MKVVGWVTATLFFLIGIIACSDEDQFANLDEQQIKTVSEIITYQKHTCREVTEISTYWTGFIVTCDNHRRYLLEDKNNRWIVKKI